MGVLGGPGAVLVKPWGVTWALLGESWGSLGGPGGVLGRHCGRPSAPDVTHTDVSASPMFSMFFYNLFSASNIMFIFLYFQFLGGPWGSLVGPSDVPGNARGALGASLWVRVTSLGVLGGSLEGP